MPPHQLLVFDVREGWEPLCKFLDVPVPATPFPNINDAGEVRLIYNAVRAVTWLIILGVPTLLCVCFYYSWKFTLLGLVLLIPLLWMSGKLVTCMVARQASKSQLHDDTKTT